MEPLCVCNNSLSGPKFQFPCGMRVVGRKTVFDLTELYRPSNLPILLPEPFVFVYLFPMLYFPEPKYTLGLATQPRPNKLRPLPPKPAL